jgi:hypothetical protein
MTSNKVTGHSVLVVWSKWPENKTTVLGSIKLGTHYRDT